jgi:hypothetical protein
MLIALLAAGMMILAACNISSTSDNDDDAEEETPAAVESPTAEPTEPSEPDATSEPTEDPAGEDEESSTPTEVADADSTPEAEETAEPWRLEPDPLLLIAESGEQRGEIGAFFWVDDTTLLALEGGAGYYERQDEPLEIEAGETLTWEITTEKIPDSYALAVFEPNEETTEGNRVVLGNEPILEEDLDDEEPSWEVDLEPGDYYLQVSTTWPTDDELWHTDQNSRYRYWVTVE